jgi:nitrogen fixation protein FixH
MNARLTGRGVLLWLTGFFVVVIAVNVYFIVLAATTFRGEDEQKPYLQGVEFNQTLRLRAKQEKLGWHAFIDAARLASGAVRISVEVESAQGKAQSGLPLHGELRHPADENRDRAFDFAEIRPGRYEAEVPPITAGEWDVMVSAGETNQPFETSRRLWVP